MLDEIHCFGNSDTDRLLFGKINNFIHEIFLSIQSRYILFNNRFQLAHILKIRLSFTEFLFNFTFNINFTGSFFVFAKETKNNLGNNLMPTILEKLWLQ